MRLCSSVGATAIFVLYSSLVLHAATPNLLTNPGFEAGLSPWVALNGATAGVTGTGVHTGALCGRATNRTAVNQGLRQSVLGVAVPGKCHIGAAWVKTSSPTPVTVNMIIQQTDGQGARFPQIRSAQVADQWTKMEGLFRFDVNGTLAVLNLAFNGTPTGVDLYVDDASFSVLDSVALENLLVNADLENGVAGWNGHGPVSVAVSNQPHTGEGAMLVSNRTATWHGVEQAVMGKMEDGRLYYASGWVTTDSATVETVRLTLEVIDSSGSRFIGIANGTASSATWTWLSGTVRMPATVGLTNVKLFLEGPAAGVAMRADNLYLAPVTGLRRAAVAFPNLRLGSGGIGVNSFALVERFRTAVSAHFHLASPANALKFSNTEPADGIWTHAEANAIIDLGIGRGGSSRGHAFVWHGGLPAWVSTGTFTAPQLQTILWDQIDTKGAYYRHRLPWWDVVNEAVQDSNGVLRSTLWYDAPGIGYAANGDQYIRESFARARAADATTALFYNDYSIEEDNTKSDAVHTLLSNSVSAGVPVQGIGFQSHFEGATSGTGVRSNFQRFNDLGLDLHVTELDFRMPVDANGLATPADLTAQGDQYFGYCGAVLGYSRLRVLQTWGVHDGASWIPAAFPGFGQALLLDFDFDRKPAYWGMWNALAGQGEKLPVAATSSGDTTVITSNTAIQLSANAARRLQAGAAGDFMTLTLHVPFPGQWNVKLGLMRLPAGGIFQASFAPPGSGAFTNAGTPRDTYNATNGTNTYDLGTITFPVAGDWLFKTTVTGRNASATDYDIAIDYVRLTPVSCSPVIGNLSNQSIPINTSMPARLVLAEDDKAQGSLVVTAASSNPQLLPNASIILEGASPYYRIAATPATDQLGSTSITIAADDGVASSSGIFVLTVTGTALQTWRQQYFGSAAAAGPGDDMADPDADGWLNLLEFSLGTLPNAASLPEITLTRGAGGLEFIYRREGATLGEVAFQVEWSDTLAPGSWSTAGVTESLQSSQGTMQTILATVPTPPGVIKRFARLRVTRL